MKKTVVVLGVGLVLAIGVAVLSAVQASTLKSMYNESQMERAKLAARLETAEERLRPLEQKQAASVRINEEFVVESQHIKSFSFKPTMVPGTLTGTWRASGQGYGGLGNSINQFRLADPRDGLMASSEYGVPSGKFFIKVTAKGNHTFFFDNSGLFRTTPRRVFLEAEYKPD
jgi:hypothetical protein